MQVGVEVHPHRGKPWCAPRTRTVSPGTSNESIPDPFLECLFERTLSYTSRLTVRQVNVRRRTRKPSATRRGAPEAPGSLAQARHVLQASGIALRRSEPGERSERWTLASRSSICLIARCRSLRIALGSRLLCRRSPTKGVSSRSFAARRRATRCERRRRRIRSAQDRAPLSWTNERADTLFVCE
jgi:hypothetical protein